MLAILFGLFFMLCGVWGIIAWFPDVLAIVRGFVPGMFLCGGLLALISGIASVRERTSEAAGKDAPPSTPSRPQ